MSLPGGKMMTSQTSSDLSERSVPDRFESFELSIEKGGDGYQARVVDSPVEPRAPVAIDPAGLDVEPVPSSDNDQPTRDVRRRQVDREDLRRVGERLFQTVFVGSVIEAFRASVEKVRAAGMGLRVCLLLDEAPELATLPWEALWDPQDRAFLADQPDLPIVRAFRVTRDAPPAVPAVGPFRLLALLPEPRGDRKLGGATEWRQILEHLGPLVAAGAVQAEKVEPPTLHELGDRIGQEPCHVLHVVAHGEQGGSGSGGRLILEDAAGKRDPVSGISLTRALERRMPPRLVVVNACHGARAAVDDAFDGLAQHLLSRGVPAVVAMRSAVTDAAAVAFSAALYRELAQGRTVEAAVVEARRELSLGEHRTEWATPALYLRGANLKVFEAGEVSVSPLLSPAAARRRLGLRRGSAVIAAAGLLAALAWSMLRPAPEDSTVPAGLLDASRLEESVEPPDPCPPPSWLQDLRFVVIDEGFINVGGRAIVVKKPFCIATKELSRRDWQVVMGGELPRREWPLDYPMTRVTPSEVGEFMVALGERDRRGNYRLPTADEWELAARAGAETDFFFGDGPKELFRYGNCKNELTSDGAEGRPAPVGSYQPNAWGLYDVHGNVAEWVEWPEDAGEPLNEDGRPLALRLGGSFDRKEESCAFSNSRSKVLADQKYRDNTGFRVVRELAEEDAQGG